MVTVRVVDDVPAGKMLFVAGVGLLNVGVPVIVGAMYVKLLLAVPPHVSMVMGTVSASG